MIAALRSIPATVCPCTPPARPSAAFFVGGVPLAVVLEPAGEVALAVVDALEPELMFDAEADADDADTPVKDVDGNESEAVPFETRQNCVASSSAVLRSGTLHCAPRQPTSPRVKFACLPDPRKHRQGGEGGERTWRARSSSRHRRRSSMSRWIRRA
jgi:hypothetical protein